MARILVFDNDPDNVNLHVDSAGNPVPYLGLGEGNVGGVTGNGLATSQQEPARSLPVRIHTIREEVRFVGWEFLLYHDNVPVGAEIVIRWWQEFYNDQLIFQEQQGEGQIVSPRQRWWQDIPEDYPWMRETALVDLGTNTNYNNRDLAIYGVERVMQMQHRNVPGEPVIGSTSDSLYVPLSVHGAWVRIALFASGGESNLAGAQGLESGAIRLKIFANVGGHDENLALQDTYPTVPYAYNAFVSDDS